MAGAGQVSNNTVYLHVCGGGAYNVANFMHSRLIGNKPGLPNLVMNYIDTTDISIKSDFLKDRFFRVESIYAGDNEGVSGSGGDRTVHLDSKIASIKAYVNQHKFVSFNPNEFHVVLFTCGGGSGSTLGPALVRVLKEKQIPVVCICIGDSGTSMTAINTGATLGGLDKLARSNGYNIPLFYYDNSGLLFDRKDVTQSITERENTVNEFILSDMNVLLAFLSVSKTDIDNTDMHMFFDQTKYSGKFKVEPGIIELANVNDSFKPDDGVVPTMYRTLVIDNEVSKLNINVLQRKIGRVTDTNVAEYIAGCTPLNLVSLANSLTKDIGIVNDAILKSSTIKVNELQLVDDMILDI